MAEIRQGDLAAIRQHAHQLKANLAALSNAESSELQEKRDVIHAALRSVDFVLDCTDELGRPPQSR